MLYSKNPLAQTVIQLCKAKNIQHIVISPGSRNAPLTIGFTSDPFFTCYSIVDERSAGFFALGIAQQTEDPVALVCTSRSALLNYYPAISEAFYSDIPLVVLSADRPKYLIGIGDGQTINQKDVFANHILFSANLNLNHEHGPRKTSESEPALIRSIENKLERMLGVKQELDDENETKINTAINKAILSKGPVHINIPFEEPLYETTDSLLVNPKIIDIEKKKKKIDDFFIQECYDDWNSYAKKMILIGANKPNQIEQKILEELAKDGSVVVFTETTSNIHNKQFFNSIDKLIAPLTDEEFAKLQPDVLVTFGGLIVSKKIKVFLRKFQPKHHWHIDRKTANDTFFCLDKHIEATPNEFFNSLLPRLTHSVKSDYCSFWSEIKTRREEKHLEYVETIPFSDFKVFDEVLNKLPENIILQLGNSSAIRYSQLFNLNKNIPVYCNRGTSGIDGSTSTAIGCSKASKKQTVLITGDLSFFYDSNALWNNYIPNNFRIILVNNQGGGIFRILPGEKDTKKFETYFETTHNLSAKHLCKMYELDYATAATEKQLKNHLKTFFDESNEPKLLEIFTPRTVNDKVLLDYFKFIK